MRLLVTETLDPDGAMQRWLTPDLRRLGHTVLPLPTQELAPLLGPDGLAAWLLSVAEAFRPDLVLLCPPYDHVSRRTLDALASLGAHPVAFAFDEPLFSAARAASPLPWLDAIRGYRHVFTTAPEATAPLRRAGLPATWLRWAASPSAFDLRADLPPTWTAFLQTSLVLVGRPYPRRRALVAALAAAGLPLAVFGHGWGPTDLAPASNPRIGPALAGPEMHAVLAAAGLVLTTGDWESADIPMVKYRLLEAAFCGAPQVVQHSPDLAAYFTPDEVTPYTDLDSLIAAATRLLADRPAAAATATRALARATRDHTWSRRFGELTAALAVTTPATPTPDVVPAAYLTALALLAHDAERRAAPTLANAAFTLWSELAPNPTAHAGLARLALAGSQTTIAHTTLAIDQLTADPRPSTGLYARLPTHVGPGLGQVGMLDPRPELEAMRLAALLSEPLTPAALTAAFDAIDALTDDPDRLVATAALLVPDDPPAAAAAWRALFAAALSAAPIGHDFSEHHARWRAALESI